METIPQPRILAISGSLRRHSYNKMLLHLAADFAREAGAEVEILDLKALQLPVYDEDLAAEGETESVRLLRAAFRNSDMLLIASPEYNHSIPGGLKNALDWASLDRLAFRNKTAAIFGTSTGPFGSVRMQPHLRQVLEALNVLVLPQPQVYVRNAGTAFNEDGTLVDGKSAEQLHLLVVKTLALSTALHSAVPA